MSRWPMVPLGEVLTRYKEYIDFPEPREYPKLSVKLYGKGVALDAPADGRVLKMKRHQIAKAGQVILSEIWGKKGAIGFVPTQGDGALCTSHFFLFDVRREVLDPRWLGWIFKANYLESQLGAEAKGTTGYAAVRPDHLLRATIPLPSAREQQRLVERIGALAAKIDEAVRFRASARRECESLISAAAFRVFEGLNAQPRATIASLGANGENPVQTGPFGAQLHKSEFTERGVPVLNVGNVWPEGLRFDRLDHVSAEKARSLSRYRLQADDLLFARSGATLGKVCLVPPECEGWLMTGHLFRVRFDGLRCEPRYAFLALRAARQVRDQVFGQVRGATRPGFNTTLLSRVELPLPPLDEQRRIVDYFDRVQAKVHEVTQLQKKIAAESHGLIPSILDRAFRNQV